MDEGDESSDPYSIRLVSFELSMRSGGRKFRHSFTQKGLHRLGDGVSVALLKIFDKEQLTDDKTARSILPIIRDSFSHPQMISVEVDKSPKVTLFLLDYLRGIASDSQAKDEIQRTIDFVKEQTAAKQ